MTIDESYKNGLAHRVTIECSSWKRFETAMNSNVIRNPNEINIRYAYALRSIGCGTKRKNILSCDEFGTPKHKESEVS